MPEQLCEATDNAIGAAGALPTPALEALRKDGRLTVAAIFGRMDEGPLEDDNGTWSRTRLERALRAIGFEETSGESAEWARFEGRVDGGIHVQVDLLGPGELDAEGDGRAMGQAIQFALRDHELVYLNGHSMSGAIEELSQATTYAARNGDPRAYAILVLDSCWSTLHYSRAALEAAAGVRRLEVIANDSESITGSVGSFTALLRGLLTSLAGTQQESRQQLSWSARLQEMNRLALVRVAERMSRVPEFRYARPERYRIAKFCAAATKKRD